MAATPLRHLPPGGYNLTGQYHNKRTVVLASMHKVRANDLSFSSAERLASKRWLRINGYTAKV